MTDFPWTDELAAEAERLFASGLSITLISKRIAQAAKHGCTRNMVMGKIHRMRKARGDDHRLPPSDPRSIKAPKSTEPKRPKNIQPRPKYRVSVGDSQVIEESPSADLPDAIPFDGEPVTFEEAAGAKRCLFAVTPHTNRLHLFCGGDVLEGYLYCEDHVRLCYTPAAQKALRPRGHWDRNVIRKFRHYVANTPTAGRR